MFSVLLHTLHVPAFTFTQPSPYAESFIMFERVIQTLLDDRALGTDLFGFPDRPALFRMKYIRMSIPAFGLMFPGLCPDSDPGYRRAGTSEFRVSQYRIKPMVSVLRFLGGK